jgi:hypothetical protein
VNSELSPPGEEGCPEPKSFGEKKIIYTGRGGSFGELLKLQDEDGMVKK